MDAEFKNERIYFGKRGSNQFWSSIDFIGDKLIQSAHRARYCPENLTEADTMRLATAVNEIAYLISILCNHGGSRLGKAKIRAIVTATKKQYANPTWDRDF